MAVPLITTSLSTSTSGSVLSGVLPAPAIQSIGGLRAFSRYSGSAGGGQVIFSGAGILKTVQLHRRAQSGISTDFVDFGGSFASGLTAFAGSSGMNILGRCPGTNEGGVVVSGSDPGNLYITSFPVQYDVPFFSGLAFSDASGANPWTCTYLPVTL